MKIPKLFMILIYAEKSNENEFMLKCFILQRKHMIIENK